MHYLECFSGLGQPPFVSLRHKRYICLKNLTIWGRKLLNGIKEPDHPKAGMAEIVKTWKSADLVVTASILYSWFLYLMKFWVWNMCSWLLLLLLQRDNELDSGHQTLEGISDSYQVLSKMLVPSSLTLFCETYFTDKFFAVSGNISLGQTALQGITRKRKKCLWALTMYIILGTPFH